MNLNEQNEILLEFHLAFVDIRTFPSDFSLCEGKYIEIPVVSPY